MCHRRPIAARTRLMLFSANFHCAKSQNGPQTLRRRYSSTSCDALALRSSFASLRRASLPTGAGWSAESSFDATSTLRERRDNFGAPSTTGFAARARRRRLGDADSSTGAGVASEAFVLTGSEVASEVFVSTGSEVASEALVSTGSEAASGACVSTGSAKASSKLGAESGCAVLRRV